MKVRSIESTPEREVSHNPKIRKHQLISKGEAKNINMFSRAIFPPGETADAHSHSDMTEVFYVASGQGGIVVNGTSVPLPAGTCVVVEPLEIHELKNTGSAEMVVLYFGIRTELEK